MPYRFRIRFGIIERERKNVTQKNPRHSYRNKNTVWNTFSDLFNTTSSNPINYLCLRSFFFKPKSITQTYTVAMVHICRHCCCQIILKSLEYDYHEMCLRIIIDATTNAPSHFQPHITRLNNWSICQNVRL